MSNIYSVYQNLVGKYPTEPNAYFFSDIPGVKGHKLGITSNGFPIFFIKGDTNDNSNYQSYDLGIAVDFNQDCKITDNNKKISGKFTLITLQERLQNLLPYFLDIVLIVVKSIPPNSPTKIIKSEIEKLIVLFSSLLDSGSGDIQGLWAELLIIEKSKKPDVLISAWHISTHDLIDFNNGEDKVEVKSTKRQDRIHTFSLHQLLPNKSSNQIIASVIIVKTGSGKNIFDLIDKIEKRLNNKQLLLTIGRVVSKTLGNKIYEAKDVFFDYNSACDSILFFNINDIPNLPLKRIPAEITNVHFDCNLNKIPRANLTSFKSKLFNAI